MEEHMGVKLAEVEQRARSNTRRIEALERGQEMLGRLTTSPGTFRENSGCGIY